MATNPAQLRLVTRLLIGSGALCVVAGAVLFAIGRGVPLGIALVGIGVVDVVLALLLRAAAARKESGR